MQLIQELTLIQKAGAFIGVPLILLLLLVAVRRRRSTAAAGEAVAAPAQPKGRRARAEAMSTTPRRKRRKLAAEGATSIGTPAPASAAAPAEPATQFVEPVATADVDTSPAPEAAVVQSPPPVPVVPAPVDDPYVRDTTFAEDQVAAFVSDSQPEVVVAAPGWPTPGELASSFDPDAFDPLPAAAEAADDVFDALPASPEVADGVGDASIAYDEPEQPTGIIEMPAPHRHEPDEPEMARWDGEFDPATGWGDDEVPVPVAVAAESEEWYDAEGSSHGGASRGDKPNPVDLEQFWGDAEHEEPWADSPEIEVISDMSVVDGVDETVPAWAADDGSATWEAETPGHISVPFPAPGSLPAHDAPAGGWTMAAPPQGSPVVLDLAGLAASGQSLELVIESNGDGSGVRLRFGSPSGAAQPLAPPEPAAELAPAVVEEAEIEDLIEASEPRQEIQVPAVADDHAEPQDDEQPVADDFDVPFLTGGRPEPEIAAETPVPEAPAEVAPLPAEDAVDEPVFEVAHEEVVEVERAEVAPSRPAPEMDVSDDPAQILADIRARLAALDQRR